jgi:hypothetical protein
MNCLTPKRLISIDFREIPAVELTCKCGGVMSIPLRLVLPPLRELKCPGCYEELWRDEYLYRTVNALIGVLRDWKKIDHKEFGLGFSVAEGSIPQAVTERAGWIRPPE